jgi:hypothetical protein
MEDLRLLRSSLMDWACNVLVHHSTEEELRSQGWLLIDYTTFMLEII